MRYISSVLCVAAVFGLVGCSKSSQKQQAQAQNPSACSGDPYLMKYNCSVSRVASAAENGDADAQYALGYMYYYGVDTARDKDSAKLWISRSAAQGQPLAKSALAMLQGKKASSSTASKAKTKLGKKQSPILAHNKKKAPIVTAANTRSKKSTAVKKHTANDHVASVANVTHRAAESSDVAQMEASLMAEPTTGYTLQLMGNHNEKVIKKFMHQHHLEGKAVYYYSSFDHSKWYMLVYGHYKTVREAHAAIAKLPPELRKLQPWIKPNRDVKAEIRTRHLVS